MSIKDGVADSVVFWNFSLKDISIDHEGQHDLRIMIH